MGVARSLGVVGLAGAACAVTPMAHACPTAGNETAVVAAVEPRLELRLADGRRLRLAGLDPAMPTPQAPDLAETMRIRLGADLAGKAVTVAPLAAAPDRWGRIPALVVATGDPPGGLAARAIAAGLGRYLAEPAARDCRAELIAAETGARSQKRGLWADPYYAVLAVDDRRAFAERSATLVLAEGRLTAIQSSTYRTTLRFAASGTATYAGHMLVATITPRTMKSFETRQMDVRALVGRHLRVRGLLDLRFGPRIELASPDQIEIVDAPKAVDAAESLAAPAPGAD